MDARLSCRLPILLPLVLAALPWCSPATAQAQATPPATLSYAERLRRNGPTGWVQTAEGRFRVLRFGTATEPHVLRINGKPPADVRSVRFRWDCACPKNAVAEFRDGTSVEFNYSWFEHQTAERAWRGYGAGETGLPVIVNDPRTNRPIQQHYPNLIGISEITFDPPEQWQSLPAMHMRVASQPQSNAPPSKASVRPIQSDLPMTSARRLQVGTRVCHIEHDAVIQESTGIVVGGKPYAREAKGPVSFIGFVEGQNADRLQIRIGGMTFSAIGGGSNSGPVERFDYKGVQLQIGSILWDDVARWTPCH
jgi:hypothetical protein